MLVCESEKISSGQNYLNKYISEIRCYIFVSYIIVFESSVIEMYAFRIIFVDEFIIYIKLHNNFEHWQT